MEPKSSSSDFEHTTEFPTSEVLVEYIEVPLEPSWTLAIGHHLLVPFVAPVASASVSVPFFKKQQI